MSKDKFFMHKEYPKTCAPDDFFGQVKRTVNGKPVPKEQIDMIVEAIRNALSLHKSDKLLDIGCGNGALASYLFEEISSYLGVDFSEYLIDVGKRNFEKKPDFMFLMSDAVAFLDSVKSDGLVTKVICYGAFSYFDERDATCVLKELNAKYKKLSHVFIGNVPDKDLAGSFYYGDVDYRDKLSDHCSPIGVWRTRDEFVRLAASAGWKAEFRKMPESFYASHYRYDVLLTR